MQKTEKNVQNSTQNLSARTIWGKVIVFLREHHLVALHIACGDITDVAKIDDTFYINTTEDFLYDLLKSEDNNKELNAALNNFGIKKFQIVKKEKVMSKSQEDLIKLKNFFGNKIIIEE